VALLLMGVMGHISDHDEARRIVGGLLGGLPAGSYLALADSISSGRAHQEAGEQYAQTGAVPYQLRSPGQIKDFFTGLKLVDPGVVPVPEWRPGPSPFPPARVDTLGGVGRKALSVRWPRRRRMLMSAAGLDGDRRHRPFGKFLASVSDFVRGRPGGYSGS
jgi:hypothetical protein